MEFVDLNHNPEGEVLNFKPDIFLAASGYESRSTIVSKAFGNIDGIKIAFAFTEHSKELNRPQNDEYFKENNFILIPLSGFKEPDFESLLNSIGKKNINIVIDISVMTRIWYHSLLKFISNTNKYRKIILRVVYCPALYNESGGLKRSLSLEKFLMHDKIRENIPNNKEVALIMGLGNSKGVSKAVHNQLKPELTTLLYADPTIQKEYVENVLITNHDIIEKINIRDLQAYPLNNTEIIYKLLLDAVLPLRKDYKIIIVPQGPKIFTLIAMIFQISYPDIELIYPKYKNRHIKDREPFIEFTYLDVHFGIE